MRAGYNFDSNVYYYDFDEKKDNKTQKKFNNAMDSYAKLKIDEIPLVLFDSTVFGNAKDGFVLTTAGIHIHSGYSSEKHKPFIAYKDLQVYLYEKNMLINNSKFSMNPLSEKDIRRVIEVINLCKNQFINLTSSQNTTEKKYFVSGLEVDKKTAIRAFIDQLRDEYNFSPPHFYYYDLDESKYDQKKFSNAIDNYAKLRADEIPLVLFDSTFSGNAKDGFVLTTEGIHIHSSYSSEKHKPFIAYKDLQISQRDEDMAMLLNGSPFSIPFYGREKVQIMELIILCKNQFTNSKSFSITLKDSNNTDNPTENQNTANDGDNLKSFIRQLEETYPNSQFIMDNKNTNWETQKGIRSSLSRNLAEFTTNEIILACYDNSLIDTSKKDNWFIIVLTNKGFRFNNVSYKEKNKKIFIDYKDLFVSHDEQHLIIKSTVTETISVPCKEKANLCNFINDCKKHFTDSASISNTTNKTVYVIEKPSTPIEKNSNTKPSVNSLQVSEKPKDTDSKKFTETDIKAFVQQLREKYVFTSLIYYKDFSNSDKKAQKKFNSALNSYAKLDSDEIPLVCCDATLFGNAKDGFILTTKGIHIHPVLQSATFIEYSNLSLFRGNKEIIANKIEIDTGSANETYNDKVINLIKDCKKYFTNPN